MVTTFHDLTPLKLTEKLDFRNKDILKMYVLLMWRLASRSEGVLRDSTQIAIEVKKIFKREFTVINLGVDKKFKPMHIKRRSQRWDSSPTSLIERGLTLQ